MAKHLYHEDVQKAGAPDLGLRAGLKYSRGLRVTNSSQTVTQSSTVANMLFVARVAGEAGLWIDAWGSQSIEGVGREFAGLAFDRSRDFTTDTMSEENGAQPYTDRTFQYTYSVIAASACNRVINLDALIGIDLFTLWLGFSCPITTIYAPEDQRIRALFVFRGDPTGERSRTVCDQAQHTHHLPRTRLLSKLKHYEFVTKWGGILERIDQETLQAAYDSIPLSWRTPQWQMTVEDWLLNHSVSQAIEELCAMIRHPITTRLPFHLNRDMQHPDDR